MMPDLDNLPDFMYAQLAIICKDDVEDAIQRCYGMQGFRQEYKITDSLEQGRRYLAIPFQLFPQQVLTFSFSQEEGTYVFAHDCTKFEPKRFTSSTLADDWMMSMYYSHFAFMPDLETVRKGITVLVECEGMTMRRDSMKHYNAFFSGFLTYYPFIGRCRHYHTGTIINVLLSLLRPILPKHLRDTFQVGFQFEGHMGDAFLTPTVKDANARVYSRMADCLRLRYQNESSFFL